MLLAESPPAPGGQCVEVGSRSRQQRAPHSGGKAATSGPKLWAQQAPPAFRGLGSDPVLQEEPKSGVDGCLTGPAPPKPRSPALSSPVWDPPDASGCNRK